MSDIKEILKNPIATIESPCTRNCCLNEDDNCLGCFRSLDEITQWGSANDEQRQTVLDNCKRRRKAYNIKWQRNF